MSQGCTRAPRRSLLQERAPWGPTLVGTGPTVLVPQAPVKGPVSLAGCVHFEDQDRKYFKYSGDYS